MRCVWRMNPLTKSTTVSGPPIFVRAWLRQAASANRGFVPALVMPRLYGALYSWRPEAPFLVASALSLLAAEVVGPWAFEKKGEKNRAPNAAGVFCGRFVGAASCAGGPLF